jgi:hypothetical protein
MIWYYGFIWGLLLICIGDYLRPIHKAVKFIKEWVKSKGEVISLEEVPENQQHLFR